MQQAPKLYALSLLQQAFTIIFTKAQLTVMESLTFFLINVWQMKVKDVYYNHKLIVKRLSISLESGKENG